MKNIAFLSMRKSLVLLALTLGFSVGIATPMVAQLRSRVTFEQGNDNAALNGTVTGREYRDFVLGARAGQTMAVSLITDTPGAAYFNILEAGGNGTALYNSSVDGPDATNIRLPRSGDYIIRVYLMGASEDENVTVPFTVSVTIM